MSYPHRLRNLVLARMPSRAAAIIAMAVAIGLAVGANHGLAPRGDVPAVSFITFAAGTVTEGSPLWSAPGGGQRFLDVEAGTRVGIGGRAALFAGLARADVFWVSVAAAGGVQRGFMPAAAVVVVAGDPPPLDLSRVHLASMTTFEVAGGPAGVGPPVADADLDIPWLPPTMAPWIPFFEAAGAAHGVDPALLAIVSLVESGGQPEAVSHAGAVGLMQIMPTTAADIARWRGMSSLPDQHLADPGLNVDFGAYYMARMLERFGVRDDPDWRRSVESAAAAYNGGPTAAQRWLDGGGLPEETDRYRRYVAGMWSERREARSATFQAWCRNGGWRMVAPYSCGDA